jgi:hypothetical protein
MQLHRRFSRKEKHRENLCLKLALNIFNQKANEFDLRENKIQIKKACKQDDAWD